MMCSSCYRSAHPTEAANKLESTNQNRGVSGAALEGSREGRQSTADTQPQKYTPHRDPRRSRRGVRGCLSTDAARATEAGSIPSAHGGRSVGF